MPLLDLGSARWQRRVPDGLLVKLMMMLSGSGASLPKWELGEESLGHTELQASGLTDQDLLDGEGSLGVQHEAN